MTNRKRNQVMVMVDDATYEKLTALAGRGSLSGYVRRLFEDHIAQMDRQNETPEQAAERKEKSDSLLKAIANAGQPTPSLLRRNVLKPDEK